MEKREIRLLSSRLTIYIFLRKFQLFYRTIGIKLPDSRMERLFPENVDFSLVDST